MIIAKNSVKLTEIENRAFGPATKINPADITFGLWTVSKHEDGSYSKFEYRANIPLSSIYVPPANENPARSGEKDQDNIDSIAKSFVEEGIALGDPPPIVTPLETPFIGEDGCLKEYRLVCGHHRFDAMEKNGYEEWVFDCYTFHGPDPEQAKINLQFAENNHKPRLSSRPTDVKNTLGKMIANKSIENTETAIRAWITDRCSNMKSGAVGNIVGAVIRANGTYQDEVKFTASDAKKWVEQYTDRTLGGKLDPKRDQHGWSMKEGYEDEYTFQVINKYGETEKESYIMGHTNGSTSKMTLTDKRLKQTNILKKFEGNLLKVFNFYRKNGRFPWTLDSWFGQDRKNNKEGNELISLDQVLKDKKEQDKKELADLNAKFGIKKKSA